MSKETYAREVTGCPKCHRDFVFLEFHLPHCKGFVGRPAKPGRKERAAAKAALPIIMQEPLAAIKTAVKAKLKPGARSAAVDAKLGQGVQRDEKLRTKKKGSDGARGARTKGGRPS